MSTGQFLFLTFGYLNVLNAQIVLEINHETGLDVE